MDEMEGRVGTHSYGEPCARYGCVKESDQSVSKGSGACVPASGDTNRQARRACRTHVLSGAQSVSFQLRVEGTRAGSFWILHR